MFEIKSLNWFGEFDLEERDSHHKLQKNVKKEENVVLISYKVKRGEIFSIS